MLCPHCNKEIVDKAAFCPYCGQPTRDAHAAGTSRPSGDEASAFDDGITGPLPPVDDDALPTDVPDITLDEYRSRQLALHDAPQQSGTPLPTAAEHRSQQQRRSRLGTIAGIMIAAGVVIIAAAAITRFVPAQQDETTTSEAVSEAATSAEPQLWTDITDQVPADGVVQTDWYRLELPRGLQGQVRVLCETGNPNVVTIADEDGLALMRLYPSGSRTVEDESKVRVYTLGTAKHDNATTNVRAAFYYLSSTGNGAASWDDDATTELTLTTRHKMTAQELIAATFLRSNDEWVPCAHAASEDVATSEADVAVPSAADVTSTASTASTAATSTSTPFYGVFIASYRDEQRANEAASRARAQGLDATVVITDEWSGLNQEHWYAICCGSYASEDEAAATLSAARSAGYSDAYIRYSGERR